MKRMPEKVRSQIRQLIWSRADQLGWSALTDGERANQYEQWTRDSKIGGVLSHYMDPRKVRVYIKDSLLKPYERARLSGTEQQILNSLAVPSNNEIAQRYIKPHGIRFSDGRIVSWGNSRDWKSVIMAMFEREVSNPCSVAFGMVLIENGRTVDASVRRIIREAANRLHIQRVEWIEA